LLVGWFLTEYESVPMKLPHICTTISQVILGRPWI